MLRAWKLLPTRAEGLGRTANTLLAASQRLEESASAVATVPCRFDAEDLSAQSGGEVPQCVNRDQCALASTSSAPATAASVVSRHGARQLAHSWPRSTAWFAAVSPAALTHGQGQAPACLSPTHQHQLRAASSSSAAKAKSKTAAKGKPGGATQDEGAAKQRSYTPDWAHVPVLLEDVDDVLRRRKGKLLTLQRMLLQEAKALEASGYTGDAKRKAVLAQAEALPLPPEDGGKAELDRAAAGGTPFEAARQAMAELVRRGVVLDAAAHLGPLLRKAGSGAELSAGLALLRANHLTQAATRRGAHGPLHGALHAVLVQECKRVGSAAPLVELWDSVYEHGMEPSGEAAAAAVRAAAELRDGRAAAALLALSCQYGREPLAATEAAAVVALVEAGNTEEAAGLRQLLPQLGLRIS